MLSKLEPKPSLNLVSRPYSGCQSDLGDIKRKTMIGSGPPQKLELNANLSMIICTLPGIFSTASQNTCMNARMFPTLSKTSMSSSPNCTKPPVSLRRNVLCSFDLKIWDKQFNDQTKSHYNSFWWLQTKAKVKTHSLWFFHQVPKQGAVHLAPSLGAGAQDGLELLNTYFHVVVIVHHLGKAISITAGRYYMKEKILKITMHLWEANKKNGKI